MNKQGVFMSRMMRFLLMVLLSTVVVACGGRMPLSEGAMPMEVSGEAVDKEKTKEVIKKIEKKEKSIFPVAQTWKTDEGLVVWFFPDNSLPVVDVRLTFKAGSAQPAAFLGLASLTNELIRHGTEEMNEEQLDLKLDSMGVNLSLSAHRDMAIISMRALSGDNFSHGIAILTDMLKAPAFPQSGLERVVANRRISLERNKKLPNKVVSKMFWETLYKGYPYAKPPAGTLSSLSKIKRKNLQDFYKKYYVARNGVLVMVGDLTEDEAHKKATLISKSLPESSLVLPVLPQAKPLVASQRKHQEVNTNQNHIRIGQLGLPRSHPDYLALYIANQVLGGGALTSVLGDEIREQRGWAYSIGSYIQPMLAGGPWIIYMQTANQTAEAAINQTLKVVENFENDLTDQRINEAVQYLRGSFALTIDSNKELLGYLSMMAFYGLPVNYLSMVDKHLAMITSEEVRKAWKKHFHPNKLLIVSAGKTVKQSTVEHAIKKSAERRH